MEIRSFGRARARVAAILVATVALVATVVVTAPRATADSGEPIGTVTEYDVGSSPGPMIASSDGSIWTGGFANQLVQVTAGGQVVLRDTNGAPIDPLEHPDGTIWFGTFGGTSVGRFQDGAIQQFPTAGAVTGDLVLGPDGKIWFSDSAGGIGNVDEDGVVFENQTHDATRDLLVGPNGNIWFADDGDDANKFIGQVDMDNNLVEYPIDGYVSGAGREPGMAIGPDGNIWFGVFPDAKIGYVSMDGVVSYVPTPTLTRHPIVGPDGNIWFGAEDMIGRIDLDTHEVHTWPTAYPTDYLVIGSDGNIWFGEYGPKLGRITPSGELTELDTTGSPEFLVLGPDGNVWFGEDAHFVGRATPDGTVTELPTTDQTHYLLDGPEGTVWFATQGSPASGALGKVVAARSGLTITYECESPSDCTVEPGGAVRLTATITNHGPSDAGVPTLGLEASAGLGFTSVGPPQGWTCGTGPEGCHAGQLVNGASATFAVNLTVAEAAVPGSTLVADARAWSQAPNPDPDAAYAEVSIVVAGPEVVPRFTG